MNISKSVKFNFLFAINILLCLKSAFHMTISKGTPHWDLLNWLRVILYLILYDFVIEFVNHKRNSKVSLSHLLCQ